jgi:hypothetical protein
MLLMRVSGRSLWRKSTGVPGPRTQVSATQGPIYRWIDRPDKLGGLGAYAVEPRCAKERKKGLEIKGRRCNRMIRSLVF